MFLLLDQFSLVIEHGKTKVFHFSRSHSIFNPPPLDFSLLKGSVLWPKENWKYLGFIFDRKLLFHQHVDFYLNKAISTIKSMEMLGNLSRDLIVMGCLNTNNFIFLFFYFSDFILILFYFIFIFILDNEEACDTTVTWQVTWCDVIGSEHRGNDVRAHVYNMVALSRKWGGYKIVA